MISQGPNVVQTPGEIVSAGVIAYMAETQTPMVSVALYCDGEGQTLGFPDNSTVPPELVFGIGSVTKVFTSTLLAYQCVSQLPHMQLTDPVINYLPSSVGQNGQAIKNVRLVDLATQTSAFPRDTAVVGTGGLFKDSPPSPEQVNWWTTWTNPSPPEPGDACGGQPPGHCWQYSNWGFITLGYAVSGYNAIPGSTYNEQLHNWITGPLGMTRTLSQVPKDWLVQGYNSQNQPVHTVPGDLKSCSADMLNFLKASLKVLDGVPSQLSAALDLTHQVQWGAGKELEMGLAWQIPHAQKPGPRILMKDGATSAGGYSCFIGIVPDLEIGIVILTDKFGTAPENPVSLGMQLLQKLIGNKTGLAVTGLEPYEIEEESVI